MSHAPLALTLLALSCQSANPPASAAGPPRTAPGTAALTPLHMVASEPSAQGSDVAPPFTLTASDGSGLVLRRVDARAVVQGPLAFTELHLYFFNPEPRTREGTFAITLPTGAAVSRFAMEIAGQFQEAEVIEKATARRVYDDFLHRRQDPALLEKAAGNQFSARVFPIPPRAEKHLVVSYSQDLPGRGYVLPLRGLPKTAQVDASLLSTAVDGSLHTQTLAKRDWQPDQDFAAAVPPSAMAVTDGGLVVATLALPRSDDAGTPPRALTLLVDTSASRSLGYARYVASIADLVASIRGRHGDLPIQVIAFDQDSEVIYSGRASGFSRSETRALRARGAAGASNLAAALANLQSPHPRLVVVTDGVMTAGADTAGLVNAVKQLRVERIDVVLTGGIRDEQLASALVHARPVAGDVLDLDRGSEQVAEGLGERVLVDVPVTVEGARWVYPRRIPAVRPGRTMMVFARLDQPATQVSVSVGSTHQTVALQPAPPALVGRAVAAAELEELEATLATTRDPDAAARLRADIARRSMRSRVLSSQTSMLVLETEADYQRYQIDRRALADILVIGPRGLEQTRPSAILARAEPPPVEPDPAANDGERVAMALDEGAAGRPAPAPARAPGPNDSPQRARQQAIEEARNAGVLGSVATVSADSSASLAAADDTYGGLLGSENEDVAGGIGVGRSGVGPGGGGTGWGTIGTGRYGTIGHGSGIGSGYGVGGGRGGMRGRSSAVPSIRIGQPATQGALDRAIVRRYIKRNVNKLRYCYERELLRRPTLAGTVMLQFVIRSDGHVDNVTAAGVSPEVSACIVSAVRGIQFPSPRDGGIVGVTYPLSFQPAGDDAVDAGTWSATEPPFLSATTHWQGTARSRDREQRGGEALTGTLAEVMAALAVRDTDKAFKLAHAWHESTPGDVLGLVALGEALEAMKKPAAAARTYGSIIDLFPGRADMRRFAGERLERLGVARELVVDTYRRAVADRPDHATGHRLLAYALVRHGDLRGAFAAILTGVDQRYPDGRFAGATRVLSEDAGMIAAAYLASGGPALDIKAELDRRGLALATQPSTRFLMYWETDANDVDFHIRDAKGGHAWYSNKILPSGGALYADVTTGYGPECFAIPGTPSAGPYALSINYFSQGPMGYGMGLLQIQVFDGKQFTFEDRPYVIMKDRAFVDLGTYP